MRKSNIYNQVSDQTIIEGPVYYGACNDGLTHPTLHYNLIDMTRWSPSLVLFSVTEYAFIRGMSRLTCEVTQEMDS